MNKYWLANKCIMCGNDPSIYIMTCDRSLYVCSEHSDKVISDFRARKIGMSSINLSEMYSGKKMEKYRDKVQQISDEELKREYDAKHERLSSILPILAPNPMDLYFVAIKEEMKRRGLPVFSFPRYTE